jgi:hypothetical protein
MKCPFCYTVYDSITVICPKCKVRMRPRFASKETNGKSDTELLLKCIFEGVGLAATEGKRVSYVFDVEQGAAVKVTIEPADSGEDSRDG